MISSFRDENDFLSNMYPCDIVYQGRKYPSVENAYQAMKCANEADKDFFTSCTPSEAKKRGRQVQMRPDFEENKYRLMRTLLDVKFGNKELMNRLLNTAPQSLVEGNWWHDNYWGICQCDKCKGKVHENKLGELLQRKRNLTAVYSDTYTMYCGSIYRRQDQAMIEKPAVLLDVADERYVVVKVGSLDICCHHKNMFLDSNKDLFESLKIFEFDLNDCEDSKPMANNIACEKMNMLLQYTGGAKQILELP